MGGDFTRPQAWDRRAGTAPLQDIATCFSAALFCCTDRCQACLRHYSRPSSATVHPAAIALLGEIGLTDRQRNCSRPGGACASPEHNPGSDRRVQPSSETWESSSRSSPLQTMNWSPVLLTSTRVSGADEQVMKSQRLFPQNYSWVPGLLKSLQLFPPVPLFLTPLHAHLHTMVI